LPTALTAEFLGPALLLAFVAGPVRIVVALGEFTVFAVAFPAGTIFAGARHCFQLFSCQFAHGLFPLLVVKMAIRFRSGVLITFPAGSAVALTVAGITFPPRPVGALAIMAGMAVAGTGYGFDFFAR
jgi:hypothetical protein